MTAIINGNLVEKAAESNRTVEDLVNNGQVRDTVRYLQQRRSKCFESAGLLRMLSQDIKPLDFMVK